LEEEMEIISNLDLMISMDSANGHIASLFGIKVLTIWGATHPFTGYGPFKQPKKNSITPNLRNYPNLPVTIYGSACPEKYLDVINTIKPEKIAKRINEII
jgi:ADP-heptose:LPS heptosyltransferase